jgi:hypothetical protein
MNTYAVPPDRETQNTLGRLSVGVRAVGVMRDIPQLPGCSYCEIETTDGTLIHVFPTSSDLEFKFEVFPLQARVAPQSKTSERRTIEISAPVQVSLLETHSWLDPGAPTGQTLGSNPVAQFIGRLSQVPAQASASCNYVGAVEIRGSNGVVFVIATGSFPYTMHVQGFYEDQHFRREDYAPHVPSEA